MKSQHTFSLTFIIKTDKVQDGKAPLFAKIIVDGRTVHIATRKKVSLSAWDQKKQSLSGKTPEVLEIIEKMRAMTAEINNAYDELRYKKEFISAEIIKAKLERIDVEHTLGSLLKYHNEELGKLLSYGTLKNYFSTERFLREFLKLKLRRSDIYLPELDHKFITDFEIYLRTKKPDHGQRLCSNNTVMKHMERLQKIMGVAKKNKWIAHDPFEHFKRHVVKKERLSLEEDEFQRIQDARAQTFGHQIVKDMFLFACYTGLAFAEIIRFNRDHIITDKDGEQWISMTRQKTFNKSEQPFKVLLLPAALEILDRYPDTPTSLRRGAIFPSFSNQTTNNYLRYFAKKAKIDKPVSFHVARHTFATTVTLENGVSIETVSFMLGHASIRTTQIYSKVRQKKVASEMAKLKEKMGGTKSPSVQPIVVKFKTC